MNINMEYYRIFYYVAKLGSMTEAASVLGTDQPNVSRIVKKMEYETGFKLFIRSGKKLILTSEGERIYSLIKGAVEKINEVELQLDSTKDYLNHNVSIACSGIAMHYIEPILRRYRKEHPDLNLKIQCFTANKVLSMLNDEIVDIVFAVLTNPIPHQFNSTEIFAFRDVITTGTEHKYLTDRPRSLKELEDIDFVSLPPTTQSYGFFDAFFKKHKFNPNVSMEVSRSDHVSMMILNNWGIGFLPQFIVDRVVKEIPIFPVELKEEIPERCIYMVTKQGHPLSPVTKEIMNLFNKSV